jgi:glycopeptide antibiotics resistance protein
MFLTLGGATEYHSKETMRTRNIGLILIGAAVLVFKSRYSGAFEVLVHSYAGNVAVSFAVYFMALFIPVDSKNKRLLSAGLALAAVELFEVFDGFGFMSNTYDSLDLAANLAGVGIGFLLDTALAFRRKETTNAEHGNQ